MSDDNGIVAYIYFKYERKETKKYIYKYFLGHNVDFKILGIKWKCIAFLSKKRKRKKNSRSKGHLSLVYEHLGNQRLFRLKLREFSSTFQFDGGSQSFNTFDKNDAR